MEIYLHTSSWLCPQIRTRTNLPSYIFIAKVILCLNHYRHLNDWLSGFRDISLDAVAYDKASRVRVYCSVYSWVRTSHRRVAARNSVHRNMKNADAFWAFTSQQQ